jgi:hypothetical protein
MAVTLALSDALSAIRVGELGYKGFVLVNMALATTATTT